MAFRHAQSVECCSVYQNNRSAKGIKSGLTGFDSGMKWYVSTRSVGGWLHNPSYRQFNWRKKLRSRCLTEV